MALRKLSVYFIVKDKLEDGDSSLVGKTEDWQTGEFPIVGGKEGQLREKQAPLYLCVGGILVGLKSVFFRGL